VERSLEIFGDLCSLENTEEAIMVREYIEPWMTPRRPVEEGKSFWES